MALNYACERFATVEDLVASASCGCSWDEVDDADLLEAVLDMASDMLALISGLRIHGVCTSHVRPQGSWSCLPFASWYDGSMAAPLDPWLQGTIFLRGPNTDVYEILVDGVPLPSSAYGLINDRYLQRIDGSPWPSSNDPTKDATQVGTWQISYRFGRPADWVTQQATIELACELAKSYTNQPSSLGQGVTSANIQGASISLRDDAESAPEAIPAIARFVALYAPEGNMNRSGVWSPELEGNYTLVEVEGPSGS